jgi:hypothetical protein
MEKKSVSAIVKLTRRIRGNVAPSLGLTNTVIERFCFLSCSDTFKGVYSADYIPTQLAARSRFIMVVNLGVRRGLRKLPVGHFVTVVASSSVVYYIDPYGLPSAEPHVNRFLRLCRRKICFNLKQIQDFSSTYCGLFAILFACYMDANGTEERLKLKFNSRNLMKNDKLCVKYLRALLQSE